MAWLQCRNGSWRILFRYKGEQHTFWLDEVEEHEARAVGAKVDYWLMRLKQRLVDLPPGCSVVSFVQHDCLDAVLDVHLPATQRPQGGAGSLREADAAGAGPAAVVGPGVRELPDPGRRDRPFGSSDVSVGRLTNYFSCGWVTALNPSRTAPTAAAAPLGQVLAIEQGYEPLLGFSHITRVEND